MRRSGITSRSKCAIFSMCQMSCSSAGPRGPAVMMLVLSATGAPVALVKTFDVDMITPALLSVVMVFGLHPKGGKSLMPQYSADLLNPSGGKIKLGNFRFLEAIRFFWLS